MKSFEHEGIFYLVSDSINIEPAAFSKNNEQDGNY